MKVNYLTLLAGATLVLLSAAAARADEPAATALAMDANAAPPTKTTTASTAFVADHGYVAPAATGDTATYYQDSDPVQDFIVRGGAWAVQSTGSQTQIGQYQNVGQSSPMFDAAGLWSNADRSVDFDLQGSDNDTDFAHLHYFGPKVEANIDYQRFDHQLYSDPYSGWASVSSAANTGVPATSNFMSRTDLSPGQDYAMQVSEFKANFKGNLTDNVKWYLNTFGMEKVGERQVNSMGMCFNAHNAWNPTYNGINYAPSATQPTTANADQCHVTSQAQHIDWTTTEVEPGFEVRLGELTVNYSHLVRDFRAGDQQIYGAYDTGGFGFTAPGGETPAGTFGVAGVGIVPNTLTQMDRLKAHADLGHQTDVYAMGFLGDTTDELDQQNRHYDGGDLRITNRSIHNLTVTGYGRADTEHTNLQTTPLNTLQAATPNATVFYNQPAVPVYSGPLTTANQILPPVIDRDREAVGLNGRWLPFGDDSDWVRRHFAVTGGYEYSTEHYQSTSLGGGYPNSLTYAGAYGPPPGSLAQFTQPDTIKNTFSVGLEEKWSESFQTYVRYKWIGTDYPFLGFTPAVESSQLAAVNTCLPTREDRVEVGGTWTANDSFMLNGTVFLETASNNGPYAQFDSNSFPYVLSAWWAPTSQWSLNAGFAEMDNWIDQQVVQSSLASNTAGTTGASPYFIPATFNNRSDVVNLGTRYAWSPKLSTCATFEYVRGVNASNITPPAGYNLGQYSLVYSETYRVTLGVDYILGPRITTFARYNYIIFDDLVPPFTPATAGQTNTNGSGQANMFLVGASAKF